MRATGRLSAARLLLNLIAIDLSGNFYHDFCEWVIWLISCEDHPPFSSQNLTEAWHQRQQRNLILGFSSFVHFFLFRLRASVKYFVDDQCSLLLKHFVKFA